MPAGDDTYLIVNVANNACLLRSWGDGQGGVWCELAKYDEKRWYLLAPFTVDASVGVVGR